MAISTTFIRKSSILMVTLAFIQACLENQAPESERTSGPARQMVSDDQVAERSQLESPTEESEIHKVEIFRLIFAEEVVQEEKQSLCDSLNSGETPVSVDPLAADEDLNGGKAEELGQNPQEGKSGVRETIWERLPSRLGRSEKKEESGNGEAVGNSPEQVSDRFAKLISEMGSEIIGSFKFQSNGIYKLDQQLEQDSLIKLKFKSLFGDVLREKCILSGDSKETGVIIDSVR